MLSGWIRGPSGCMDLVYVFSIQQFRARHCFHSSRSGLLSFSYIPGLWGRKESDTTERLIWSDLILASLYIQSFRQPGLSVPVMGHMQPLSSMLVKLAGSGVVLLGWIMTPPLTDLVTRASDSLSSVSSFSLVKWRSYWCLGVWNRKVYMECLAYTVYSIASMNASSQKPGWPGPWG